MKKVGLLVIDDEPVITEAVVRICSSEGYSVDAVSNARDAVSRAQTGSYGVMLCDIMMPEMDGFQFLAEMARKEIHTPVIMLTGYSTLENAVKSLYDGAIDFVPKPFTVDELVSAIRRATRYGEIQESLTAGVVGGSLPFVPCPSKYYRLGYRSWVVVDHDGTAQMGATNLFTRTTGELAGIQLLRTNDEVIQGSSCSELFSSDGYAHQILCPLSGRILEENEKLLNSVSLIEKDPYFEGWLYRILPSDMEYELQHLIPCSSDRL